MRVAAFLALTIAGCSGALVAAAWGAEPALFAGALVVAFFGLAGAAASAAVALHDPDDLREPRVAHGPSAASPIPPVAVSRGTFGKLWLGAGAALAALGLVPLIALARKPGRRTVSGWRAGVRLVDEDNRPLTRDRLAEGGIETVFPQDGVELPDAPAVLIRLEADVTHELGRAPEGYVAYSKICTHAGCPVAQYRHASHELYCPCHQSRFDVLRAAKNVSGPAPRPLPRLAVSVDAAGYLIADGDFDGPVGPDDWDPRA